MNDAPTQNDTLHVESPTPKRRGRKKKPSQPETPPANDTREHQNAEAKKEQPSEDGELFDYDDGIDFPYEDPPLVCCFGAAQREFIPGVRVQMYPMHPDKYSEWKMLQWKPPEFARVAGGYRLTWRWRTCGLGGVPRFWERLVGTSSGRIWS
ncbi:Fructokinase-like 1 [Vigna angularis]|uniref:Fructokinase-like 1 n=1 Tax=Phaseolus angularis TaxID=3914 RepID=A0A8T0KDU3_PHAAN|nr:Fructokinase-like 1 [Vigna angularis]